MAGKEKVGLRAAKSSIDSILTYFSVDHDCPRSLVPKQAKSTCLLHPKETCGSSSCGRCCLSVQKPL